jgi:hypothetical protein
MKTDLPDPEGRAQENLQGDRRQNMVLNGEMRVQLSERSRGEQTSSS